MQNCTTLKTVKCTASRFFNYRGSFHCSTTISSSQQISGRLRSGDGKIHGMQTPRSNGPHHTACTSMSKAQSVCFQQGSELGPLASSQATGKEKNLKEKHENSNNRRALEKCRTWASISFNCFLTFYLQIRRALSYNQVLYAGD